MISLREYMIMFGEKSGVFNKISSFIVSFNRSTSFDRWKKFEDASSIGVCFLHFFNCLFFTTEYLIYTQRTGFFNQPFIE